MSVQARPSRSWRPAWCSSSCRATSTCRSGRRSGFTRMFTAMLKTDWIPTAFGLGFDLPFHWIIALAFGIGLGRRDRRRPGVHHRLHRRAVVHRHARRPARRSAASSVTSSRRARRSPGLDAIFQLLGGGPRARSAGPSAGSSRHLAVVAIICTACATAVGSDGATASRVRPMWAEVLLGVGRRARSRSALVWFANSYSWPKSLAQQYAQENNIPIPAGGLIIPTGIADPDPDRHRRDPRDDLPRDPTSLRPVRLRDRRQPRRGRARRHQHAAGRS